MPRSRRGHAGPAPAPPAAGARLPCPSGTPVAAPRCIRVPPSAAQMPLCAPRHAGASGAAPGATPQGWQPLAGGMPPDPWHLPCRSQQQQQQQQRRRSIVGPCLAGDRRAALCSARSRIWRGAVGRGDSHSPGPLPDPALPAPGRPLPLRTSPPWGSPGGPLHPGAAACQELTAGPKGLAWQAWHGTAQHGTVRGAGGPGAAAVPPAPYQEGAAARHGPASLHRGSTAPWGCGARAAHGVGLGTAWASPTALPHGSAPRAARIPSVLPR